MPVWPFGPSLPKPETAAMDIVAQAKSFGLPEKFSTTPAGLVEILTLAGTFAQGKGVKNLARRVVEQVRPVD